MNVDLFLLVTIVLTFAFALDPAKTIVSGGSMLYFCILLVLMTINAVLAVARGWTHMRKGRGWPR